MYSVNGSDINIHRASVIAGMCGTTSDGAAISRGSHVVMMNVGKCEGFNETFNAYTGFSGVSSVTIEEIPNDCECMPSHVQNITHTHTHTHTHTRTHTRTHTHTRTRTHTHTHTHTHASVLPPMSLAPQFSSLPSSLADNKNAVNFWPNTQQCTRAIPETEQGNKEVSLQNCTINKQKANTVLKVSWYGNIALEQCSTCCMRWYITIDDKECVSPGPIDAAVQQTLGLTGNSIFDVRRPVAISGICYGPRNDTDSGFNASPHSVKLLVGPCAGTNQTFPVSTGYNSISRFIIDEIAKPTPDCEDAVIPT